MSFKREGDDWSQLNVLKKRRVGDLLASYIPEDEAMMLRDGRFACAICAHRPVLDTLAMLTAHRAGKKHLSSLQRFYGAKQPGKGLEPQPRQQEESGKEIKAEVPLLTQTRLITQKVLHRAAHYNSCCRRKNRPEAPRLSAPPGPPPLPVPEVQSGMGKEARPAVGSEAQEPDAGPTPTPTPLSPTMRRTLDHYLHLRSSGWIPDGQGRWVKDANVEFDSDEEEPPGLPLD